MQSSQEQTRIQLLQQIHLLLAGLWRRRQITLIAVVVMPVLGLFLAITADKRYVSYTTILVQEAARQNPFLEDLTVSTNLADRMPALKALLHSRHILANVGKELGYLEEDGDRDEELYFVAALSDALSVNFVGEDLVRIQYESNSPKGMVEMLDTVSKYLVERIVAPEHSAISGSEVFLKQQIDQRHVELFEAETRLAAFKSEHAIELPELHASSVNRLVDLRNRVAEKNTKLAGAVAELDTVRQKLSQTNPLLAILEKEIVDLSAKRAILRSRFTAEHSEVRAIERTLKSLEEERDHILSVAKPLTLEELDRLWNRLTASDSKEKEGIEQPSSLLVQELDRLHLASQRVKSLEQEVTVLETQIKELSTKVAAYGETELQLNELERELDVRRDIYKDLVERSEMAKITQALGRFEEAERIKIIDPPVDPYLPSNLPFYIYVLLGLFAGVFFGLGTSLVLTLLDTSIQTRHSAETIAGVKVLARVSALEEVQLQGG